MIEVKNVTKRYRKGKEEFIALDDINIRIDKGDYCSLNGASGAGKSTLLYTIGGLIHPDEGSVLYNTEDIYSRGNGFLDNYRKRKVGFMFQQFHLMPWLTVSENIRLGCTDKERIGLTDSYLEKCELLAQKNKYPSGLSVGEKQRAAFIRAIISDPEILLADEPTGNLDPANSKILMSLIADYHSKGGTVILVSHNPDAAGHARKRFILEKGKITAVD
jgi:putative ABC transport system ATP-binding protein